MAKFMFSKLSMEDIFHNSSIEVQAKLSQIWSIQLHKMEKKKLRNS